MNFFEGGIKNRIRNIGLRNIGNSCYLNSILQSLASLPSFVSFLASLVHHHRGGFPEHFLDCLSSLQVGHRGQSYDTRRILEFVRNSCEDFGGNDQQDAQELLQLLMSILDQSQKQVGERMKYGLQTVLYSEDQALGQDSNPFEGFLSSHIECHSCSSSKPVRHQLFLSISLTIPSPITMSPYTPRNQPLAYSNAPITRVVHGFSRHIHNFHKPSKENLLERAVIQSKTSAHSAVLKVEDCLYHFTKYELIPDVECAKCTTQYYDNLLCEHRHSNKYLNMISMLSMDGGKLSAKSDQVVENNGSDGEGKGASTWTPSLDPVDSSPETTWSSQNNLLRGRKNGIVASSVPTPSPTIPSITDLRHSNRAPCSSPCSCVDEETRSPRRSLAWKYTKISRLPKILCLHLQRRIQQIDRYTSPSKLSTHDEIARRGNRVNIRMIKVKKHVGIQTEIDMSNYVDQDICGQTIDLRHVSGLTNFTGRTVEGDTALKSTNIYELKAVVVHTGSADAGHYYAYRSYFDDEKGKCWLRISDDQVESVGEEDVLRSEAYILFYERKLKRS